jgi:3-dehydroquinate dehydratase II
MKILVINGPNLNTTGRDKKQYGSFSLTRLEDQMTTQFPDITFHFYQSNIEGEIINEIQGAREIYDGIIINPGGFAHTSVAIRDALEDTKIPKIEVHLSNLAAREDFRQILLTAGVCDGYISGFKELSYISAVYLLKKILERTDD